MFRGINLQEILLPNFKEEQEGALSFVGSVNQLLSNEHKHEQSILRRLSNGRSFKTSIDQEVLDQKRVCKISDIEKIAIQYQLRFLPSKLFNPEIPFEAIQTIKRLESANSIQFNEFYVLAPSELFNLEDVTKDPLLLAKVNDDTFYFIYKWGTDLSWNRWLTKFPSRNKRVLFGVLTAIAALIALAMPTDELVSSYFSNMSLASFSFMIWSFLFVFGCISLLVFSRVKELNNEIWNSPFFNK